MQQQAASAFVRLSSFQPVQEPPTLLQQLLAGSKDLAAAREEDEQAVLENLRFHQHKLQLVVPGPLQQQRRLLSWLLLAGSLSCSPL
jgi:hypothetical protein